MVKKVLFAVLVLFALVFSEMAGECFADVSAQLGRAKAYRVKGCYEQAEGIFKTVAAGYPGTEYALEAQKRLAMLYIESGQTVAAQTAIGKLTADFSGNSGFPNALYRIAKRYGKSWKYEEAKSVYQQIIQQYPDSKYARKSRFWLDVLRTNVLSLIESGDYTAAQAAIDKLVNDFSGHSGLPSALYWIAKRYEASEKYEEAKNIYKTIATNYSGTGSAFWPQKHLAVLYIELGDYTEAQAVIDKLVNDYSSSDSERSCLPEMLCSIAAEYKEAEKYEEAKSIYQQVIQQYPDSPYVREAQLGVSAITGVFPLIEAGNDTAAQAAIDSLIADFSGHPGLPEAVFVIGAKYYNEALRKGKEGHSEQAKEYFQKAIKVCERVIKELPRANSTASAYYYAATCYRRLGEYEKAIDCCKEIVDNWPDDSEYSWSAQFMIGFNYELLSYSGAVPEAVTDAAIREAYEKVIERYPNCKVAEVARSWLDYHQKK